MLQVQSLTRAGLECAPFTLNRGESLCVSGPSGSGKSLLLRAIADLDPNEADIRLGEKSRSQFSAPEWRRRVMYFAADSGWWADKVGEHFQNVDRARSRVTEIGLPPDCFNWQVRRLSTGEKQRLALLRGLLLGPEVMLLDEPTSALDPDSVTRIEQLLNNCKQQGTSLLIITHSAAQTKKFGPRKLRVEDGKVIEVQS